MSRVLPSLPLRAAAACLCLACGPIGSSADVPPSDSAAVTRAPDANALDSVADATMPAAQDSAGTLLAFQQRASELTGDSASMQAVEASIAFGAGVTGTGVGWRTGSAWRRVRVVSTGERFRTVDEYWFSRGSLMGARLEMQRDSVPAEIDSVWFRDGRLYRWTDRDGRHLNRTSRSTESEVEMLHARLDAVLRTLKDANSRRVR